ncbi:MAG: guanylate kinase [Candidatus Zixiibacteriota bacterium]
MKDKKAKGKIIIVSSPSGGGKSSICRKLLKKYKDWSFSISVTTRKKRPNEKNGREYCFVDHAEFLKMRDEGKFAEWCKVHTYLYGTPRAQLEKVLYGGGVMLLDVDVKGAKKLKKAYPMAATIFILPPSRTDLRQRLKKRGTEDDKQLKIRQKRALSEMKLFGQFEYTVINNDLITAVNEVDMIINSLHCRKSNLNLELINRIVG